MLRRVVRQLGRREGFTLIELIVVVAILALLAAIAAPKIGDVISKSREARKKADLKVLSGSLERYFNDKGEYPAKLQALVYEGYLKGDFDFKNAYGKRYFYAVDDVAKPQHYAVGDPGKDPVAVSVGITTAPDTGTVHTNALPEGKDPTATAFGWRGSSPDIDVYNVAGAEITNVPPSLAHYCSNWDSATGKCAAGADKDRPFRYDLITD